VAHLSLHHFFDWRWISFSSFTGWMIILANCFNALAAAAYLMLVVSPCIAVLHSAGACGLYAAVCAVVLTKLESTVS